jgi:hypothetical protein
MSETCEAGGAPAALVASASWSGVAGALDTRRATTRRRRQAQLYYRGRAATVRRVLTAAASPEPVSHGFTYVSRPRETDFTS